MLLFACAAGRAFATSLADVRNLDPAVAQRILALSPDRITEDDVRDALSHGPTPRIILIQGSAAFVTMAPFAAYLIAMGYPEDRLALPRGGGFSYSSFTDSERLAGELAWYYEQDGTMPMLIGHSQGGMLAIRVLYELAGDFRSEIPVRDPVADAELPRTTIQDPLTGKARPVVGLTVGYATALATGKLMRVLLGQWSMLSRLRTIPDTVDEFTGFSIPGDPIAGNLLGEEPYRAAGHAHVRNVTLPASYSHIGLPQAQHLATNATTRAWIDDYVPDAARAPQPGGPDVDTSNLVHAADIWYSVKRRWCLEAQRIIRAVLAAR